MQSTLKYFTAGLVAICGLFYLGATVPYSLVSPGDKIPVLEPEESMKTFDVADDFRIELVAAEPLVEDPVAIDIDPDGRMWVVEMRGYMTRMVESEYDYQHRGNVAVLEDTDGDGRMDKRTVFMDSLNLPRSVRVLEDGVLVGEPPNLWFAKDTDGDLKADEKVSIRSDYGSARGNPESMPNSPRWGMDNWIHNTDYPVRFKRTANGWEFDETVQLGQWGITMDNRGRFYRNSNSDPLRFTILDAHYYLRNPDIPDPQGINLRIGEGALEVYPGHPTPGVNRGYRPNVLRPDSTLRTFTSASGLSLYRGDKYPEEFQGDVFVPEPAAHMIRLFDVIEHEDGTLEARNAYEEQKTEFLTSTDRRFRPVNAYNAPDGSVYLVDFYRGVIQHRFFLSQYLKNFAREHGLMDPVGLGRIYRIVYEPNPPRREPPSMTAASNGELVEYLSHPNGWWRDTAQQMLVEREATDVLGQLRQVAQNSERATTRLHALWTIDGLDGLDRSLVEGALADNDAAVRSAGVRLAEKWLEQGDSEVLRWVRGLTEDPSPQVRLQIAASLGTVPPPAGDQALVDLLTEASDQPYLVDAVLTSLNDREVTFLATLGASPDWNTARAGYEDAVARISETVVAGEDPDQINRLLALTAEPTDLAEWHRLAIFSGIERQMPSPRAGVERPLRLEQKPPALDQVTQASNATVRKRAKALADRMTWPGKPGYTEEEATLITERHKELYKKGKKVYQQACSTCHLSDGTGQEGVANSLVDSRWVLGQRKDLLRIVLDGKEGETGVMPGQRQLLSDEEVAAVTTYIRNAWGNQDSPITVGLVEEVRRATATREKPWSSQELEVMQH